MKFKPRMTRVVLGFCLLFWFLHGQCQRGVDFGFELQAYPTGLIPGWRLEVPLNAALAANFRVGYNFIRHGDSGKHEDERGHGWGGTLGMKRYFSEGKNGWFAGLRTGVWFNSLDWKDNIGQTDQASGKTDIVVVQPTVEAGYCLRKNGDFFLAPALAFGKEWNVKTAGSPTEEGLILLAGFTLGF